MNKKEFKHIVLEMKEYCEEFGLNVDDFFDFSSITENMTLEETEKFYDNFDRDLEKEFLNFLSKI